MDLAFDDMHCQFQTLIGDAACFKIFLGVSEKATNTNPNLSRETALSVTVLGAM